MTISADGRAKPTQHLAQFFTSDHLPLKLRAVAVPVEILAEHMIGAIEDSTELTAGLRKLLEAKDCFVRAALLQVGNADLTRPT